MAKELGQDECSAGNIQPPRTRNEFRKCGERILDFGEAKVFQMINEEKVIFRLAKRTKEIRGKSGD